MILPYAATDTFSFFILLILFSLIVIGFGIKDGTSARAMAELSDGVVIGSALVAKIAKLAVSEGISEEQISFTIAIIKEARKEINKIV